MHYDKDLIYIGLGLLVVGIYTFKPAVLIHERTFKIVALLCAAEFLLGVVMITQKHSTALALLAPLPTLGYFRLCLRQFRRLLRRDPVDVAYNWSPGLFKDRVFAFVFVGGAMAIFFAAISVAKKLTAAGWY